MKSSLIISRELGQEVIQLLDDILNGEKIDWLDPEEQEELQLLQPEEFIEWANDNWDQIIDDIYGNGNYWRQEYGIEQEAVQDILTELKSKILRTFHQHLINF